jgi:hypothetical protein
MQGGMDVKMRDAMRDNITVCEKGIRRVGRLSSVVNPKLHNEDLAAQAMYGLSKSRIY